MLLVFLTTDEVATSEYWCRHVREAVRFAPSMNCLVRENVDVFLEVGPKPILLGMGRQCIEAEESLWLPSLRPPQDDWQQLLNSLAQLYRSGINIDWHGFDQDYIRVRENLPTYPFQRQRYWLETPEWYRRGKFDHSKGAIASKQKSKSIESQTRSQISGESLEKCLYEVRWQPFARIEQKSTGVNTHKHWLVFADNQGVGEQLVAKLQSNGSPTTVVIQGKEYQRQDERHFSLNPERPEEFQQLLQALPYIDRIIHLWSLDAPQTQTAADLEVAAKISLCSTLHLVQSLIQEYAELPRLWLVTRGAQPVGKKIKTINVPGIGQSPLWGMGKAITLEYPELQCSLVDLDPNTEEENAENLLTEITLDGIEEQVAFRNGTRYLPQLVEHQYKSKVDNVSWVEEGKPIALTLDENSTYLITGGLGGLGLEVAGAIAERGGKHLVLVGRSEAKPEVKDRIKELETAGVKVMIASADVSDANQLGLVLNQIEQTLPPLRGIIHAAGVVDFCGLWQQDWRRFEQVLAAKVQGTWNLHNLTKDRHLDFFVCFSSLASLLGSHGLASYGAANGFMDAIAHHRRSLGLPGLSINWGAWAEVGMSARLSNDHQQRLSDWGLSEIAPERGLAIMEQLLQEDVSQIGVLSIDWSKWLGQFDRVPQFYQHVATSTDNSQKVINFAQELKVTPVSERRSHLVSHIRSLVAKTTGLKDVEQIQSDTRFVDLGLDSLMAMELRHHLQSSLGCSVPSTFLFNYSTLAELVAYLAQDVLDLANAETISLPSIHQSPDNIADRSTVVPIQPEGSQLPLFFATGILGGVFDLYPLAKYLGTDRPFYGLRYLGTDENENLLTRIEDIAAYQIKSIQKIQPHGPYFLGGHSFGGKVAFEMAQQLRSQGHEVSFLAIMDIQVSIPEPEKDVLSWDLAQYISNLSRIYGGVLGKDLGVQTDALRLLDPDEQLGYLHLVLKMADLQFTKSDLKRILEVYKTNIQASVQYRVQESHPIPMILFRAQEMGVLGNSLPDEATTQADPTWGWEQVTTLPVQLQLVPGNHFTMILEPQVRVLGEKLKALMIAFKESV